MDINSLKVLLTSLPGRYAKALFLEGKREKCLDEISGNFDRLETFLSKKISLKKLLTSYCMNQKDLTNGWIALGDSLSFCPVFTSFMRTLIENRRFDLFAKVKYVFHVALTKYKNRRKVKVSTAVELLPEQKKNVEAILSHLFKEKSLITYKINEKLLGGIKISSEELQIDASVAAKLRQLSKFYKNLKIEVNHNED